uniref:Myb/SANT-like domain-containing protein n=1 Tax=Oryza punctata TaxID=4537 RepID=A0A0E0MGA9_ORYPU
MHPSSARGSLQGVVAALQGVAGEWVEAMDLVEAVVVVATPARAVDGEEVVAGGAIRDLEGASVDDDEEDDEDEIDENGQRTTHDKATWTEENTYIFCEIACEELRAGNCIEGTWTTRGYQNIKEKFYQRTGLRHRTKQVKNKFTTIKNIYVAWLWLSSQTGLGRGPIGEIIASDAWWKENVKDNSGDEEGTDLESSDEDGTAALTDTEFDLCDQDENYDPMGVNCPPSTYGTDQSDSQKMNQFRDWVADGLWSLKQMYY